MKMLLPVLPVILFTVGTQAQTKLFLKKGSHKVRLKPASTIGIITRQDTLQYDNTLWKLDSILPQHLTVKKPAAYDYRILSTSDASLLLNKGWEMDSVLSGTSGSLYRLKRPITYQSVQLRYNDITEVRYAKSENTSGCIGCIIFPIMVIAAPFAGWDDGKFRPAAFIPFFTIGVGGSLLVYFSFKRRELKTYQLGLWSFVLK